MSRHRYRARPERMPELTVATLHSDQIPSGFLDPPDHFANLHPREVVARMIRQIVLSMWQVETTPALGLEQSREFSGNLGARFTRQSGRELCAACSPIQALDLIGEYDTFNRQI